MKSSLKILIDILFVLHCLGLAGFFFILPFEIFSTRIVTVKVQGYEDVASLPVVYWVGIALSFVTYILFLIGLNYLRRTARHFVLGFFFSEEIIHNLKRSGSFFVFSGIVLGIAYITIWGFSTLSGSINLTYGTNIMIPMFLCIVGLFFVLQSTALRSAKLLKEENDLTV